MRVLATSPRTRLAGVVELDASRAGEAGADPGLVHRSIDRLLAAGPLDFAIVALPTQQHAGAAAALAEAGVPMLIEKPLAGDVEAGREIVAACRSAGVLAAVGHVERYNPALVELRSRVLAGELGDLFMVTAVRLGPYPDRVRDIGVVRDLATHDLDVLPWIAGQPVTSVAAYASRRSGREHEDLVAISGHLSDGTVLGLNVDWLTPVKVRRTRVVGEGGMLVASSLTAELAFYESAATSAGRGRRVVLQSLARREPLLAEVEAFCDLIEGRPGAHVVSLEEGLGAVALADAVLDSAARGKAVAIDPSPSAAVPCAQAPGAPSEPVAYGSPAQRK